MTSAQSPSSFRADPHSNGHIDNIQINNQMKLGSDMSSPQRPLLTEKTVSTTTPENISKILQKNSQKGTDETASIFSKFILESSLEKPSGIRDFISNYKSVSNVGLMTRKDLKGPFSSPSFQEGKTDLSLFKKTGSIAGEKPKPDIASTLNQIIQSKKLENAGACHINSKSIEEESDFKKGYSEKSGLLKGHNIKNVTAEDKASNNYLGGNHSSHSNNRTLSINGQFNSVDKSSIGRAFEDLENYHSEKITINRNESARKRDYRSAEHKTESDSVESKDFDFCKKHLRKKAKYYVKGKEDAKFCSKCALLVAMNGDQVEKFLSQEESIRKCMSEEFLLKVRALKENILDLENLLKKQKNDSETFSKGQKEKILQIFTNLEEMIRAKKEACLHQLELKVNSTQNYLETRLTLISKYRYELERFSNDVNQNFENIVKNIQMTPFREIMKKYNDKVTYLERSLLDFHKSPIELLICKENSEKLNLIREDLKNLISIETVIPLDSNFGSFSAAPKCPNDMMSGSFGRKSSGKKKSFFDEEMLNSANKENSSVLGNLKTFSTQSNTNVSNSQLFSSCANVRSSKGSPLNTVTLTLTEEARETSNRNLHNRPKKRPQPQNIQESTLDHNISNCNSNVNASPAVAMGKTTTHIQGEKVQQKKQITAIGANNSGQSGDCNSFKLIDENKFMVSKQNLRNSLEKKNLTVNNEHSLERGENSLSNGIKYMKSGRGNSGERDGRTGSNHQQVQKENYKIQNRENNENKDTSNMDNNNANMSCLNSLKSSLLVNRGKTNSKASEDESLVAKGSVARGRRDGSPVGTIYTQILNSLRNETKRSPSESSNKSGSPDERLLGGLSPGVERKTAAKAQMVDGNKPKRGNIKF